ncbi:MAG: 4-(cytidine 5'-diphospho)-2-C-methyl-D-erythritol kinase [Roseinatronobacter sp.]
MSARRDVCVEPAPAKINLTLHVTGRRADGYHLLDSLVVFAQMGDRVSAAPGHGVSLGLSGPEAGGLDVAEDNLVLRAARVMSCADTALHLEKHLPVASGIGGGSSDAAATLRLLARRHDRPLPDAGTVLTLGADVPVCLAARPCRMRGIGEQLAPVPSLPECHLVLVNPRQQVATPAIFGALACTDNAPMPDTLPEWPDAAALCDWLQAQRNDLQAPALAVAPVIAQVLAALSGQPGCALARMSGSGATCFGLFATAWAALAAARSISRAQPDWWCVSSPVLRPGAQFSRATT